MDKSKSKIFQNQQIKRYLFLLAIILILIVVFSFLAPGFFSVRTFFNIIRQTTSLAILSLGITFIIMLAGTDLSSGANIALAGACGAIVMQSLGGEGLGTALCGFLVCIIVGIAAGSANGLMVGGLGISPFMATLAMTSVSRGLTIYLTNSKRVTVSGSIVCDYVFGAEQDNFWKKDFCGGRQCCHIQGIWNQSN